MLTFSLQSLTLKKVKQNKVREVLVKKKLKCVKAAILVAILAAILANLDFHFHM